MVGKIFVPRLLKISAAAGCNQKWLILYSLCDAANVRFIPLPDGTRT
jgi:hypothetical protein